MHYSTHALLSCVALLSLLCDADAGRTPPPSEVLSHFARTVGTVLNPTLIGELQRPNRSVSHQESANTIRRQVDTRQISPQNAGVNSGGSAERNPRPVNALGNLPFPGQGFPYQLDRNFNLRYPPFNQQFSQNFYPGGGAFHNQLLPNGLPFDPRFFQSQFGRNPQLPINQPGGASKGANAKLTAASDGNVKENGNNNVNTLQNLESNGDSKSSAQRPYDNTDFSSIPINPGQGAGNLGLNPSGGNLRVENRFSGIDYGDRVRQNYFNNPSANQRYYPSSFNEIPFNAGPPYRSNGFANSNFNGAGEAGRPGAAGSDFRGGNGFGNNPYFGNFFQGPYQSLNYNNIPGSGAGGVGLGGSPNNDGGAQFSPENFDRGSQNFRSPFGLQYPNGFGGPGIGANFGGQDGGANFGGSTGGGNFGGPTGGGNFGGPASGNFGSSAGGANNFVGPAASGNFGGSAGGANNFGGPGNGEGNFGPGGPEDAGNADIGESGGESTFISGGGFSNGDGDSSLRASSAKQTIARPHATESSEENRTSLEQLDDRNERERIDRGDESEKHENSKEKRSSSQN